MAKYRVSTKNFSVEVKSRLSFRDQMNERELNYILQNQIPGLFVTSYVGKKRLIYEAPQAESIKKYLKKHRLLKENSFWKIASQIVHIAIETESRGLRASRLLIDKDLMFIQENTMDMFFIYQPAAGPDRADGVFVFLLDLVYREIKNGGGMNQDYLFDFQNYLQQYGHELERIQLYIEQAAPWLKTGGRERSSLPKEQTNRQVKSGGSVRPKEGERHTIPLNGSETWGSQPDQNVTTELTERICMIRIRDGSRTELSGNVLNLGRSAQNEYCIQGNGSIGRKHAVIEKRDGDYYIRDLGSVNQTHLNDKLLNENEWYLLRHGDRIRLADEEFMAEF